MNVLQMLTRRPRAPKHGSDEQLLPANAAPSPDSPASTPLAAPVLAPQGPTFTPNALNLASTQPFSADAPPVTVAQGGHARTVRRHEQQEPGTLRRVRDGLRDLPLSRADQFTADLQKAEDGGIPVFRWVVARRGFCGLDEEYPVAVLSPRNAERLRHWEQDCLHVIAAQVKTARIEISGIFAERDRYETRVRAAADAALALGYPGGTL